MVTVFDVAKGNPVIYRQTSNFLNLTYNRLMLAHAPSTVAGSVGTVDTQFLDLPDPVLLDLYVWVFAYCLKIDIS